MSRLSKIIIGGIFVGMLGVIASTAPLGIYLEENIGLEFLFRLRGVRKAPPEVLIVNMDEESALKLNLDPKTKKWPRAIHAELVERLIQEEVAVIVFDIFFQKPNSPEHDRLLAKAIEKARNVVLCESLSKDVVKFEARSDASWSELNIERSHPPIPLFADAAISVAPFPLPKKPVRVSRFWVFKDGAGNIPTLPATAFQVYCLSIFDEFLGLAEECEFPLPAYLPKNSNTVLKSGDFMFLMEDLREVFTKNPKIGARLLRRLHDRQKAAGPSGKETILASFVKMYSSPASLYLNYYGPAGTISTVPYYNIMEGTSPPVVGDEEISLRGKAVFVGVSERDPTEQKDSFHTVYSREDGLDLSGVEIAATAFANLLEDQPIRPLPPLARLLFILAFGMLVWSLSFALPAAFSAFTIFGFCVLYFLDAHYQFGYRAVWRPIAVPLLLQAPLAYFGAVSWKYFDSNRERRNIKKAFAFYLPEKIVEHMATEIADMKASHEIFQGTCLCTDGEQYAKISESMSPLELRDFLNCYYEVVFQPVRKHGGIVTDIIGDSMLAIWSGEDSDILPRIRACRSALEIHRSVLEFNRRSGTFPMPTRIGMHYGCISLGNIGGVDHFEYRPVGDVVNTAARLESLNKHFGTTILASREVLCGIDCFLSRKLGKFILAGKSNPVDVYELLCQEEKSTGEQRLFCELFSRALEAYSRRFWDEAAEKFETAMKIFPGDMASKFYLRLCKELKHNPPDGEWDGYVRIATK